MADEKALWYVVHTYSGYENKVANDLVKTVENNGMGDLIQEVTVPIEEVVEIRNGKPHTIQHKLFPGYVLVKMIKTTESWYVVRNTRGVTGFVGPGSEPIPLTDEEYERMTSCQGTIRIDLEPGDNVRIKSGSVGTPSARSSTPRNTRSRSPSRSSTARRRWSTTFRGGAAVTPLGKTNRQPPGDPRLLKKAHFAKRWASARSAFSGRPDVARNIMFRVTTD